MATADPNAIREAAVSYGEMGFRVIPIHGQKNGFCHCSKGGNCKSGGKHPVDQDWPNVLWSAPDMFKGNIGIVTGPASGLLVVDVDTDEGKPGIESLSALLDEHPNQHGDPDWPETYTTKTGGGGWQYYFRYDGDDIGNSAGKLGPGIDTRGKGGYVVAPPSVSTKGEYRVVRDVPVADAPEWLLALLRPKQRVQPEATFTPSEHTDDRLDRYINAVIDAEVDRLKALAPAGWDLPWDQTTFEVACNLTELANSDWSWLQHGEVENLILDNAPPPDNEGWDVDRVLAKIESARTKVGDSATLLPADRDEQADLHALAGVPYNPDEPAAESAVKPRAGVVEPEVTAFTEERLPDPESEDLVAQRLPKWLDEHLIAGSKDLFWEAVGAVLTGDAALPVHLTIKGAPSLAEALTYGLGAIPAPGEGVVYAGSLSLSTVENDETEVVIEFDQDLPITTATLAAIQDVARGHYESARTRGSYAAAEEAVASRDVGDYRINSVLRAHIGQRRTDRGDADEFNMGG